MRQNYKDEKNGLLQGLFKLTKNRLNGAQIRKDFDRSFYFKSEHWMQTEVDEIVLFCWKLPIEKYIVKMEEDD